MAVPAGTGLQTIDELNADPDVKYAEADQIVKPNQSFRLANALRRSGQRVGLLAVPWAGHGFDAVPLGLREELVRATCERFLASALR